MTPTPSRPRFTLTLEHVGGGDATLALRMALKTLLRRFGFRSVSVAEHPHGSFPRNESPDTARGTVARREEFLR